MTTPNTASMSPIVLTAGVLAALTLSLTVPIATAQTAETAAAPATIVLKAGHVFDSTGTELPSGATVLVRGDRIVSVGNAPSPAGARVIYRGDAAILPGVIASHVH